MGQLCLLGNNAVQPEFTGLHGVVSQKIKFFIDLV
jgi:hypothetical protein